MLQTVRITVKGKVQGVYYRQSTFEKALELGISGNVRNLSTGDVTIIATGTEDQLSQLIEWCKKGPPNASVTSVTSEAVGLQRFNGFLITR